MIGTGYVGLVSGACFSEFGIDVVCVDMDAEKIARLEDGIMPIYEPGLDVLVANNVSAGRLSFDGPRAAVRFERVFIAVGTPSRRGTVTDPLCTPPPRGCRSARRLPSWSRNRRCGWHG